MLLQILVTQAANNQAVVTPRQTSLDMPKTISGGSMSVGIRHRTAQISPDERYQIVSATKLEGKWIIRILDTFEKKTYTQKIGVRNGASGIIVENFDSDKVQAEINTPSGKYIAALKKPDSEATQAQVNSAATAPNARATRK